MPANLIVQPSAALDQSQWSALAHAATTLPDAWTAFVTAEADRITVRIVGISFATVSNFSVLARPEALGAFAERVRREHG